MTEQEKAAVAGLIQGLLRDMRRGSLHASLVLLLAVAYISRADLRLPPPSQWMVPSVAVH